MVREDLIEAADHTIFPIIAKDERPRLHAGATAKSVVLEFASPIRAQSAKKRLDCLSPDREGEDVKI